MEFHVRQFEGVCENQSIFRTPSTERETRLVRLQSTQSESSRGHEEVPMAASGLGKVGVAASWLPSGGLQTWLGLQTRGTPQTWVLPRGCAWSPQNGAPTRRKPRHTAPPVGRGAAGLRQDEGVTRSGAAIHQGAGPRGAELQLFPAGLKTKHGKGIAEKGKPNLCHGKPHLYFLKKGLGLWGRGWRARIQNPI